MMFSPFAVIRGVYGDTLLILSLISWVLWEMAFKDHTEQFWSGTNEALRCENCTDKLCTQWCKNNKHIMENDSADK